MSTPTVGVEPKRKRGHLRVAAIIQAGIEVFAEKGYDAATMTEIATRSKTAVASLYRFFPSKDALADVLILQYAHYVLEALDELRGQATGMTPESLAKALTDLRVKMNSQRQLAIELADARGLAGDERDRFHSALIDRLADILRLAVPGLTVARSKAMAPVVWHVLRAVPTRRHGHGAAARNKIVSELRELLCVYIMATKAAVIE